MPTRTRERHPVGAFCRMGVVAGLHVIGWYTIVSGLGVVPHLIADSPIPATLLPEDQKPDEPPPALPEPAFNEPPPVVMPRPVVQIDTSDLVDPIRVERRDEPSPTQIRAAIVEPPAVPAPLPVILDAREDARHPLSQPPYPMSELRRGNEGSLVLEVYVLPSGRVGDVRVTRSTGFPALDQSAMEEARRHWRFLPAERDGVPFAQWHRMRVVFRLEDSR